MIPRLWSGDTVVCIGGGPSLTAEDVAYCRGRARVIAINDAYRLAPWADVLYACDGKWWDHHQGVPSFTGLKFGLTVKAGKWSGVERLTQSGMEGFDPSSALRTGGTSGFQAIQVAVHLGALRILLLGYDMQLGAKGRSHWFGHHPVAALRVRTPYDTCCRYFRSLVAPLKALGVEVINCSRETALTCFPRQSLESAFTATDWPQGKIATARCTVSVSPGMAIPEAVSVSRC